MQEFREVELSTKKAGAGTEEADPLEAVRLQLASRPKTWAENARRKPTRRLSSLDLFCGSMWKAAVALSRVCDVPASNPPRHPVAPREDVAEASPEPISVQMRNF